MNVLTARFRQSAVETSDESQQDGHNPAVADFLNRHLDLADTVRAQAAKLSDDAIEIGTLRTEIEYLRAELNRASLDRDKFAQGFFALNAEMGAISMQSVDAIKSVANAMVRCLDRAKAEMAMVGIKQPVPAPKLGDGFEEKLLAQITEQPATHAAAE